MTPTGHFTAPLDATLRATYLGIAAGSGITPLLSLVKTVLSRETRSRFFLLSATARRRASCSAPRWRS